MKNKQKSSLIKRIAVSVFGIPIILGANIAGAFPFLILLTIIMLFAAWEFYKMIEHTGYQPVKMIGLLTLVLFNFSLYLINFNLLLFSLLISFSILLMIELFKTPFNPISNISSTFFGVLYSGLLGSLIIIRQMDYYYEFSGKHIINHMFITIWICDSMAYFYGRFFGKKLLFEKISPKKTWEGSLAGFFSALLCSVLLKTIYTSFLSLADAIILGVIIGLFGQIGDLAESMLKRYCKFKDSSNILPGHGGFLDRFDSSLFTGIFLYLYIVLRLSFC